MIDTRNLTITKAAKSLKTGEFTAVMLAEQYLSNIKQKNSSLNAYLEVYEDALDQARKADAIIKSGKGGILAGIPIALKDNIASAPNATI